LTLDASARVDPRCTRFVGTRFREEEFALVSAEAQRKLRRPELQERASELSNNASVSIFMNHLRVWRLVSASADDTPVLVLEDDAVLPPRLGRTLGALLERLRADNASNYVVKLHDLNAPWTLYEWAKAYRVERHDVRRCTCRPSHNSASNAAYLLDRRAAGVLLRSALPLSVHADVYVHEMGCVRHQVRLYNFMPNLVETSNRPSTHMRAFTLQRLYLLAVEALENMLAGECTRLHVL
jgi:GR25 family glycosyltransferase involved in LPS biosynthesis